LHIKRYNLWGDIKLEHFMKKRTFFLLVMSLGIGASIPVFFGGTAALSLLAETSPLAISMLISLVMLTWLFNASRVFLLLNDDEKKLSFFKALALIIACDFSVKVTPAGFGGPITAISFLRKMSIHPTTTVVAFSLLFLIDVILMLASSLILYIVNLQKWAEAGVTLNMAMTTFSFIFFIIMLTALICYNRKLIIAVEWLLYKTHGTPRFKRFITRQYVMMKRAWRALGATPVTIKTMVSASSILYWLTQFSILYACLHLLDADITWVTVAVVQFMAMGAGRLTLLPAGSGGLEAVATALLILWVPPTTAAAAVLLWRGTTLFPALVLGALSMFALGINLSTSKNAFPEKRAFYLR
tara:strand:- start:7948 stop:9015 length:1068 start_codon:yes stop_codon:yes gene_type:complete